MLNRVARRILAQFMQQIETTPESHPYLAYMVRADGDAIADGCNHAENDKPDFVKEGLAGWESIVQLSDD